MNTTKRKIGWSAVSAALVLGLTAVVIAAHRERELAWDDGRAWGHDLRSGRRTAHEFAHYINWKIYQDTDATVKEVKVAPLSGTTAPANKPKSKKPQNTKA